VVHLQRGVVDGETFAKQAFEATSHGVAVDPWRY
jgi:hypothetical protein